ncbi:esterase/lipase family protein [Streptomyces sp. TP-A0874]|uniref:esterase/lipase family protein n=1 Tax=Streptomyces sp. TP-A0874 TaxID=549819 RepID=UPI000852BE16|nr:alpha/beta fold hydrolase [Streptomyces sp. TP-A0874]
MKLPWKRLAAAVALTLAVTATPASAAADAAPSRGWNDYDCRPSAEHPRPVVLTHGTGGNSIDNWLGLAPYLVARGYCVFSLDYGQLPGVPLIGGLGPIPDSARQLSDFTDRVLRSTGAGEVDIVGHSQGGMMPRYYLKFLGGAEKVNALVGISPSSHGTTMSGLATLAMAIPALKEPLEKALPGLTSQVVGSEFLNELNEGGDTVPGVDYTVIATRYDLIVTPYQTQFLEGPNVKNVLIQDLCPVDVSDHLTIALVDRIAFHEVANALDPEHATPTDCGSAFS